MADLCVGGSGSRPSVQMGIHTHPIFHETDPRKLREMMRNGEWTGPTRGVALGYVQANLTILPKSDAFDFLVFCQRNPKPCPVLEVTEVGDPEPRITAPGADLRTDLPRYHVFQNGELTDKVTDIVPFWRDDFVAFLLGCSLTFESVFLANGIPLRHLEEAGDPFAFKTDILCTPAGKFKGPMVVSMRPMPISKAIRAVQVTSRFPFAHGAPVHIGAPSEIGISDMSKPDWGTTVSIKAGEVPVFWACGSTPLAVALEAKPEIMITHAPGHMFVTDLRDEHLAAM